jgi:phage terminase large subunit-like protein
MSATRFSPTAHPVLVLPSLAETQAMGAAAWGEMMKRREEIIRKEKADPFVHGFEPPIWKVCDALLGMPWVDEDWAERLRRVLGFAEPVDILLGLGGNRASKSQWASKLCMKVLRGGEGRRCWAFHSTLEMSREYQQPLFRFYMPEELCKKDIKSATTYIAYKQKTGFTEERFILPSLSNCTFKSYDQDVTGIEGGELDIIWPDELVPAEWVETLELRIATRHGKMPVTFTPIQGYSDTVAKFMDGAEVVKESIAFLLPKDGGPADPARALGLTQEEYEEVLAAAKEKRVSLAPQSRPERCERWVHEPPAVESLNGCMVASGKGGDQAVNPINEGQPAIPEGREFERTPRVMRCSDPKRAVVFFHSSDNPYGNPKEVWHTIRAKGSVFIAERFYGVAKKLAAARFSKFNTEVHVIDDEKVPRDGTNYHLVDPHSARNFFMMWARVRPDAAYVYREFPGNYYIPEIGVPGPWATASTKQHPDGIKGPGQEAFGFGHARYKQEIARLEGWKEAKAWEDGCGFPQASLRDIVKRWDQWGKREEMVAERFMDSRFASVPKEQNDLPVTLLTEFDDIGLTFKPAPGLGVEEGCKMIEDALFYDSTRPLDFFNRPKLFIARSCVNTIFALRVWTGLEKDRGATKEPIDLLRWLLAADCQFRGEEEDEEEESNYWSRK